MTAGQNAQSLMDIVHRFAEVHRESLSFFNGKEMLESARPRCFWMRTTPRSELDPQGPHGQREPCEPKTFISKLEELSVAERRVVLLLVNPVLRKQPLDQSLRVALRDHANGPEGSVEPWDLA